MSELIKPESARRALELHPLALVFPPMAAGDRAALKDDIAANGLLSPIALCDGQVLDGRHRYELCLELGIEPAFVEVPADKAVAFVLSANLRRRHLSPGQAAVEVAAAQDWEAAAREGGQAGNVNAEKTTLPRGRAVFEPEDKKTDTASDRAAIAGVGIRTQSRADKLVRHGSPEAVQQVVSGEKSLPAALAELEDGGSSTSNDAVDADPVQKKPTVKKSKRTSAPCESCAELRDQLRELATQADETHREYVALIAIMDSDDRLAAAFDEIKRLSAAVAGLKERIYGLTEEKDEAIKRAKSWKRKAEKAGVGDE
jgi:predicted transcriptional regulator